MARILAFSLVALIMAPSHSAIALDHLNAPQIVTKNCSGCHAIDGNSQAPYFPRLAGLDAVYAEQKIAEFKAEPMAPVDELFNWSTRNRSIKSGSSSLQARTNMVGISHAITADETSSSVKWYAAQKMAAGRSGATALIKQGQAIFANGLPAQGLIACQSCHGANAEGKGKIPRLAGQNGEYLLRELNKFQAGDRRHAPEMTAVAQKGDIDQFRALAAYLQSR